MEIGERIKNLRESLDMTQQELAKKAGVGVATVQNYERKQAADSVIRKTIVKLADALATTPEFLLTGDDKLAREDHFWRQVQDDFRVAIKEHKGGVGYFGEIKNPYGKTEGQFALMISFYYDDDDDELLEG